jgi:adenine-specific DNA-methyltransferase
MLCLYLPARKIKIHDIPLCSFSLGQHNLITVLKKESFSLPTKLIIVKRKNQTGSVILRNILSGIDSETIYSYKKEIFEGTNNYIRIASTDESKNFIGLFENIVNKSQRLDSILNINSGCDVTISKISDKHLESFPHIKVDKGEGVFVLNKSELQELHKTLSNYEKSLIKTFIKNSDINQFTHSTSEDFLLYIQWSENPKNIPNLINHLSRYKLILKDQVVRYEEPNWPWFSLHRPREQSIFESSLKILVPYRSKVNSFAISSAPIYSSRDVFFITNKEGKSVNLYAVLAILNSRLIYYWLLNKGKRKGDTLELYNTPLSEIPISTNLSINSHIFERQVKEIIKRISENKEYDNLINDLNNCVYKLYELSYDEVLIV